MIADLERKSSIDSLSDEELHRLIEEVTGDRNRLVGRVPSMDGPLYNLIWRLAPDAVVKLSYGASEAYTMQLVRSNTSIPVPAIRRVLPDLTPRGRQACQDHRWIVMDYIEGSTLFELWGSLTEERKSSILDVLGCYVRELQSVRLPNPHIPGPLHPSGEPVKCNASFFSEVNAGPFRSYQEMADWFERQRRRCRIYLHRMSGWMMQCPKFDASLPLVLCHMDIHPRNVLIDNAGTPWLVDWGVAGAYPPWFEYAAIAVSVEADYRLADVPAWKDLVANVSTVAGDYARYHDEYLSVLFRCTCGLNFDDLPFDFGIDDDYFEKLGIEVD